MESYLSLYYYRGHPLHLQKRVWELLQREKSPACGYGIIWTSLDQGPHVEGATAGPETTDPTSFTGL